ncbi:YceI family protein [Campylobacter avium]|uniref:YceI family protein n=1 Tax=Campylobacter avium TaxID=522485 RepID=UPI00248B812E|nr:YceI family protein [Campylobacter avium]
MAMFFVNSVESGDKTRDEHIRGEVLFDSKKYPIISFKMSKYEALSSVNGISKGKIYGLMNAHGVSKDIVFDSTVKKTEEGYILTLNSTVDVKKDFNMQSYSIMSNSVDIDVSLCF